LGGYTAIDVRRHHHDKKVVAACNVLQPVMRSDVGIQDEPRQVDVVPAGFFYTLIEFFLVYPEVDMVTLAGEKLSESRAPAAGPYDADPIM